MAAHLALAVKERRERLGLTLRALAGKSGVSSSMISDIERRAKSPTLATLATLAEALEMPLSALVDREASPPPRLRVLRAAERRGQVDPASGIRRDSVCPAMPGSRVDFMRYTVPPHGVAGPFPAHAGRMIEHVYLAAGRVRVTLGDESVMLHAGDACSCVADRPHGFDNRESAVEAVIYVVAEPA